MAQALPRLWQCCREEAPRSSARHSTGADRAALARPPLARLCDNGKAAAALFPVWRSHFFKGCKPVSIVGLAPIRLSCGLYAWISIADPAAHSHQLRALSERLKSKAKAFTAQRALNTGPRMHRQIGQRWPRQLRPRRPASSFPRRRPRSTPLGPPPRPTVPAPRSEPYRAIADLRRRPWRWRPATRARHARG